MEQFKGKLEESSIYYSTFTDPEFAKEIMFVEDDELANIVYPYWKKAMSEEIQKEFGVEYQKVFLETDKALHLSIWEETHYYSFFSFLKKVKKAREIFFGKILENPKAQS